MSQEKFLEIACFEIHSAEIALNSVVDRIEFCSDLQAGGLTPNIEEFKYLKSKYNHPIHVMIRPTAGSFIYSTFEFDTMLSNLMEFQAAGADGFVFGILQDNSKIDEERNKIMIELAKGKPCVFHRAIDRTKSINESFETLIKLGFSEVLTSGGKNNALEGKDVLKTIIKTFGDEIKILVGGGVRSSNIHELILSTGGNRFHSSSILPYEHFANAEEIKKLRNHL